MGKGKEENLARAYHYYLVKKLDVFHDFCKADNVQPKIKVLKNAKRNILTKNAHERSIIYVLKIYILDSFFLFFQILFMILILPKI